MTTHPLKVMQFIGRDDTAHCLLGSWLQFLRERGARVAVVCALEEHGDALREVTDELFHIPFRKDPTRLGAAATALDVLYLVQRWNPGIIHTHCASTRVTAHFAALRASVPLVIHSYHTFESSLSGRFIGLLGQRAGYHQIAATQSLKQELSLSPRATVIPHPVNLEDYTDLEDCGSVRERLDIPQPRKLLGSSGRMAEGSGCMDLLESFSRLHETHPETHLLWAGQGPLSGDFVERARELGLENFVSVVTEGSIPALVNAMDLYVRPGHRNGSANSVVQALALEKPVVATVAAGYPEVVIDQASCLLVPPGELELLTDKATKLLDDPAYAGRLAAEGRRLVEQTLSEEKVNTRLYGLYRNLWTHRLQRLAGR